MSVVQLVKKNLNNAKTEKQSKIGNSNWTSWRTTRKVIVRRGAGSNLKIGARFLSELYGMTSNYYLTTGSCFSVHYRVLV